MNKSIVSLFWLTMYIWRYQCRPCVN